MASTRQSPSSGLCEQTADVEWSAGAPISSGPARRPAVCREEWNERRHSHIAHTSIHLHTYIYTYVVCTGSTVILTCIESIHVNTQVHCRDYYICHTQTAVICALPFSLLLPPACLTSCLHSASCSPPESAPVDRVPPCDWSYGPSGHSSLS